METLPEDSYSTWLRDRDQPCFFCGDLTSGKSVLTLPFHDLLGAGAKSRGYGSYTLNMEYNSRVVYVPRCQSCRSNHRIEAFINFVAPNGAVVVLLVGGLAFTNQRWVWVAACLLLLVLLLLLKPVGYWLLYGTKKNRLQLQKEHGYDHPEAAGLIRQGWKEGIKPSGYEGRNVVRQREKANQQMKEYYRNLVRDEKGAGRLAAAVEENRRIHEIASMGTTGDPQEIERLLELLQSPTESKYIVLAAGRSIFNQDDPRIVPALKAAIKNLDPQSEERKELIQCLYTAQLKRGLPTHTDAGTPIWLQEIMAEKYGEKIK